MVNKLHLEKGTKFGKWEIISEETIIKNNLTHWKCQCECGNEANVPLNNLMNEFSTQCSKCGAKQSGKKRRKGHKEISGDYWSRIRHRAKNKNILFNIRIEEAWNLFIEQNKRCALSNEEIEFSGYPYNRNKTTAILSLIDPYYGYEPDNIQWIHKNIQKMKGKYTNEELFDLITKISSFQGYQQKQK